MGDSSEREVIARLKRHAWIAGNPAIFGAVGFVIGFVYVAVLNDGIFGAWEIFVSEGLELVLPLVAAGAAFGGILLQVKEAKINSEEQRLAALRAAKATLPLALSEMVRVCNSGIRYAVEGPPFFKVSGSRSNYERDTAISAEVLATLRSCIEYADYESALWLSILVQHYQVANARFLANFDSLPTSYNEFCKAKHIGDWIIVKALAEHLFDYSRGAAKVPENLDPNLLRVPLLAPWYHKTLGTKVKERVAEAKEYYAPFKTENFKLS